jgi:hypothetical protein
MSNQQRLFREVMDNAPVEFMHLTAGQGLTIIQNVASMFVEGIDVARMYMVACSIANETFTGT